MNKKIKLILIGDGMLPLTILEKTDNSIIYEIPGGKPNPKQMATDGLEARDRVMQSASKGGNCWYYTFNFIRNRIGKNPCQKLLEERNVEKLCSQRRKEITAYDNAFPISVDELFSESEFNVLWLVNQEKGKFLLNNKKHLESLFEQSLTLDRRSSIFPYIEDFVKENKHKNLRDFLICKRSSKTIEINMKFLRSFKVDVNLMLKHENWEKFNVDEKSATLDSYVRDLTADFYKLKRSSWKPNQGVNELIQELRGKGPLMVLGNFGVTAYEDEPFKMKEPLCDRDVYAWKPGAKREATSAGHAVLLIGAKKVQDKAYVYFIDCVDPSDPKDRSKQKIYMISFTNLTSNIYDLVGRQNQESTIGYAYTGNFKI